MVRLTDGAEAGLRTRAALVAATRESVEQFQDWFVPFAWLHESSAESSLVDSIRCIELALAEFSDQHLTETEFVHRLAECISPGQSTESGTSSATELVAMNAFMMPRRAQGFVLQPS